MKTTPTNRRIDTKLLAWMGITFTGFCTALILSMLSDPPGILIKHPEYEYIKATAILPEPAPFAWYQGFPQSPATTPGEFIYVLHPRDRLGLNPTEYVCQKPAGYPYREFTGPPRSASACNIAPNGYVHETAEGWLLHRDGWLTNKYDDRAFRATAHADDSPALPCHHCPQKPLRGLWRRSTITWSCHPIRNFANCRLMAWVPCDRSI